MNRIRAAVTGLRDRERGMSLIEVIVAVSILGILATASLGIYLTSSEASSLQRSREIAITVANQQLEVVSSWAVEGLYDGRNQAKVQAQWAAAVDVDGLSATHPRWDSTAGSSAVPAIALQTVSEFSGTEFTVDTYLGECFQPAGGGNCTALASAPTNGTALIRAIVVVSWTAGDYCEVDGCSYEATTLLNGTDDLEWVTND